MGCEQFGLLRNRDLPLLYVRRVDDLDDSCRDLAHFWGQAGPNRLRLRLLHFRRLSNSRRTLSQDSLAADWLPWYAPYLSGLHLGVRHHYHLIPFRKDQLHGAGSKSRIRRVANQEFRRGWRHSELQQKRIAVTFNN